MVVSPSVILSIFLVSSFLFSLRSINRKYSRTWKTVDKTLPDRFEVYVNNRIRSHLRRGSDFFLIFFLPRRHREDCYYYHSYCYL